MQSSVFSELPERRAHRHVRLDRTPARRLAVDRPLLFEEVAEFCPAGIVIIGRSGRIRYSNRRAQRMVGLDPRHCQRPELSASRWQVTDFDGRPQADEDLIFSRIMKTGVALDDMEHAVLRADGTRIYLRISGQPIFKPDGSLQQVIFTMVDVSAVVHASQALRASERRFASTLEHAPIGMATVSLEGQFTMVNQALCRITGYDREALQKLTFHEITYPDDLQGDLDRIRDLLAGTIDGYQMEKRYVRQDGGLVWIRLSVSLARDDHGAPLHYISQIEDITEQRRAQQRIRASEERQRLVLDNVVDYAIYMLDQGGCITMWNPGCERVTGYAEEEILGQHTSRFYPPEAVREGDPANHLAQAESEGRREYEGWRMRKDGSRFWANVVLTALRGEDRTLRGFCQVMRDLTATRRIELELRERKERLEQSMRLLQQQNREISEVSELSNLLQSCVQSKEIFTPIRRYCRSLFPGCAGALYVMHDSRNSLECVASWDIDTDTTVLFEPLDCWALRRGQLHQMSNEDDLRCSHVPESLTRDTLCVPMMAQSEILGMLHLQPNTAIDALASEEQLEARRKLAEMVSERIGMAIANLRLREKLRAQSIRDPLTRLFNRRYLEESLLRELAQAERSGDEVALLMLDLDHFKRYNDSHGHEAGDAALVAAAEALVSRCRTSDIVCRYGGEELVMVLPRTTLEQAQLRAEDARAAVAAAAVTSRGRSLPGVTISVGVAVYPRHTADFQSLLAAADRALYGAKQAGRNRVHIAPAVPANQPAAA
jgi:diguanylate cyclase (GGDEF)-like protein/PAS domain S-box-containing protein